jgi:pyruvate dehydrogenase E1 component
VTLLGSGAILGEVIRAAQQLAADGIPVDVFSVTSWSELARDGQACQDSGSDATPWLAQVLAATSGPVVAASDYVRAVPESVRAWVPAGRSYRTLGTDGFGRSDTRADLRRFFEVDRHSIALAALSALGDPRVAEAAKRYGIEPSPPPWTK